MAHSELQKARALLSGGTSELGGPWHCKVCGADLGWDRPSGVCSQACLDVGQGFWRVQISALPSGTRYYGRHSGEEYMVTSGVPAGAFPLAVVWVVNLRTGQLTEVDSRTVLGKVVHDMLKVI